MVVAVAIKAEAEVEESYIVHVCIRENDQGCPVKLLECIKYCLLEGIQYPISWVLLFAMAAPITWLMNMDLGDESVRYPVLKS